MNTNPEIQQEMFALVEQYKASTQTLKSFCQEHHLPEWRYYYWAKKFAEQQQPTGFVPVRVSKKKTSISGSLDIYYPNGIRISVPDISNLSLLQTLIRLG